MEKRILVELTRSEINIILTGITNAQYPMDAEREAFNLVLKLRDKLRETS